MILQAIKTVLSDRDIRILNLRISSKHSQTIIEIGIILSALILMLPSKASSVDTSRHAQVLTKHLEPEEFHFYELSNLKKGDTLYVYLEAVSGNLDPIVALAGDAFDFVSFERAFREQILPKVDAGQDFLVAFPDFADKVFLAWNNDGGKWNNAVLTLPVETPGDYKLIVAGGYLSSDQEKSHATFGRYRLIMGLNTPEILTGQVESTDSQIAKPAMDFHQRVQEITENLTRDKSEMTFELGRLDPWDTLYVFVEAVSGDLKPSLKLRDFGGRILGFDNVDGKKGSAMLQHTFKEKSPNASLRLEGVGEGDRMTTGGFRLQIGLNTPGVTTGKAKSRGRPLVREPIEVQVGIQLDQISSIDQKAENFTIVGNLFLKWVDSELVFNPDSCKCRLKVLNRSQFEQLVGEKGVLWPDFIFYNQQGRRWTQQEIFNVRPDGEVTYFERFTMTLQAPDFDFRKFPFDIQQFYIRLVSIQRDDFYVYTVHPEVNKVGKQLGEEEWRITTFDTHVSKFNPGLGRLNSQFNFRILAKRHLSYYFFRIYLPLSLIIIVSWVTFFMKDYSKRVDVSTANMLTFVAFNFAIGSDLPRLGYLTFLDTIVILGFIVTALTVVCNVVLKRMDASGRDKMIRRADKITLWGYPSVFVIGLGILAFVFL
jgi:hypothetical protein